VAYHDPCHLKKALGIHREPRFLIDAAKGYRLSEMQDADKCCGMGGSFNVQYYKISKNIGTLKRNRIVESGCDIVATGCPACMIQMSDVLSGHGDAIRVKHFIELYAESLE
jgi:glycolate oxidase iron-sulfur subunit